MLAALVLAAAAHEPIYSLIPPLERTNLSELGNWTFRGSAVNMKSFVRLTSDALMAEYGALCYRAKTPFRDWILDIELLAKGGPTGGTGFTFLFTDEVCPEHSETFTGLQITVNTTQTDESGESPVYFSESSFEGARKHGHIRVRNIKSPIRLQLTKRENELTVQYTEFMRYLPLFEVKLNSTPEYGYFTIASQSTAEHGDNNDIHAIWTRPESDYKWGHIPSNQPYENRKVIETNAVKRRERKQARRDAMLQSMHRYLGQMEKSDNSLARGPREVVFKDAFRLVEEAQERGTEAVTIDHLKVWIHTYVMDTIGAAGKKVREAMDRIEEAKGSVADIWSFVREELMDLATETKEALTVLSEQSLEEARRAHIEKITPDVFQDAVENQTTVGTGFLTWLLPLTSVVEGIAYLIFFCVKRQQTHGFKKMD
jgi:hypothetical protein